MNLLNFALVCFLFSKIKNAKTRGMEASTDFIGELSNDEIDSALNDLSLSELTALSQLIDSNKEIPYNTDGNRQFSDKTGRSNDFNDHLSDEFDTVNAVGKKWYENPELTSDFIYTNIDLDKIPYREDYQRPKREYNQLDIDQEYIKQLRDSFPRDSNENVQNNEEINTQHIRVKRN